jgi:hypothetical protein
MGLSLCGTKNIHRCILLPNDVVEWLPLFRIRKVPDSILGPGAAVLNVVFRCFPQSLNTNAGIIFQIRKPLPLSSKSFIPNNNS